MDTGVQSVVVNLTRSIIATVTDKPVSQNVKFVVVLLAQLYTVIMTFDACTNTVKNLNENKSALILGKPQELECVDNTEPIPQLARTHKVTFSDTTALGAQITPTA